LEVLAFTETHVTVEIENVAQDATGKWRFVFIPAPPKRGTRTGRGGLGFLTKEHFTINKVHN